MAEQNEDGSTGKHGGVTVFGQAVSFPQLVNMLLALVTLVGLYFGVIGKINTLEATQAYTSSSVSNAINRLTTEFIALERRVDEEERTSERLSAMNSGAADGVIRLQNDLNQLEVYIRNQFTQLRDNTK